jgi:hypothetical protein
MPDNDADHATNGQLVTVYTHFTTLLAEKEKQHKTEIAAVREIVELQHKASEQAVKIASDAMTMRLNAGNEIRASLDDLSRQMAKKSELDSCITGLRSELLAMLHGLEADVRILREERPSLATRTDIRPLENFQIALEAKATTDQMNKVKETAEGGRLLAVVGTIIGILGFAVTLIRWAIGG